MSVPVRDVKQS